MSAEEQEVENNKETIKGVEAAKQRSSWLQSRQDYKQERLDRIKKMKEAKDKPDAPTMEELSLSGNSY